MSRTLPNIRQFLIDTLVAKAANIGISINPNLWSKSDYKNLILDTVATAQDTEEQLWDQFKSDINNIVLTAPPESDQWIRDQLLNKFQFDSTSPQLVSITPTILEPNFAPKYTVNNDLLKIIKFCSVQTNSFGISTIKVAAETNNLPADIDTKYGAGTLDTIKAFIKATTNPAIKKTITSGLADRLFMQLDVYFNGSYAPIIQPTVIAAINSFLAALPYNGTFLISDFELSIKAVPGVIDYVPINIRGRSNATIFPLGKDLVINSAITNRLYNSTAGYIISEDSVGNTLTDPRPTNPTINNLNLIPS